jgi:nicotinamidase/pyrazinamidase
MPSPHVFVDIDTQRDFLEPTGALAIAEAESIVPNLRRLICHARTRQIPVIATACAHSLEEPDPEPFPPHCLVGTTGQTRIEATTWPGSHLVAVGMAPSFNGIPPHVTLEKNRYDLFSHPFADMLFARYAQDDPTFFVFGVATEYCVRAAVLGLRDRGYRTEVVVDAIRPVRAEDEPAVLTEFVQRGAVLTLTSVVCRSAAGHSGASGALVSER